MGWSQLIIVAQATLLTRDLALEHEVVGLNPITNSAIVLRVVSSSHMTYQ